MQKKKLLTLIPKPESEIGLLAHSIIMNNYFEIFSMTFTLLNICVY